MFAEYFTVRFYEYYISLWRLNQLEQNIKIMLYGDQLLWSINIKASA